MFEGNIFFSAYALCTIVKSDIENLNFKVSWIKVKNTGALLEYMKILFYFVLKTCRIHFQGVFITYDDEKIYTYLYCRESTKGNV